MHGPGHTYIHTCITKESKGKPSAIKIQFLSQTLEMACRKNAQKSVLSNPCLQSAGYRLRGCMYVCTYYGGGKCMLQYTSVSLRMWVTLSAVSITYQLNRSEYSVHSTLAYILRSTQTPGQGRIKTRCFAYIIPRRNVPSMNGGDQHDRCRFNRRDLLMIYFLFYIVLCTVTV